MCCLQVYHTLITSLGDGADLKEHHLRVNILKILLIGLLVNNTMIPGMANFLNIQSLYVNKAGMFTSYKFDH